MSDDFYKGLCDVHLMTMEKMNGKIARLRSEVRSLNKQLADQAPAMWEQQEIITALELRIASMSKVTP